MQPAPMTNYKHMLKMAEYIKLASGASCSGIDKRMVFNLSKREKIKAHLGKDEK